VVGDTVLGRWVGGAVLGDTVVDCWVGGAVVGDTVLGRWVGGAVLGDAVLGDAVLGCWVGGAVLGGTVGVGVVSPEVSDLVAEMAGWTLWSAVSIVGSRAKHPRPPAAARPISGRAVV
jgi:hypothetical protein